LTEVVGIHPKRIKSRQHAADEMTHYPVVSLDPFFSACTTSGTSRFPPLPPFSIQPAALAAFFSQDLQRKIFSQEVQLLALFFQFSFFIQRSKEYPLHTPPSKYLYLWKVCIFLYFTGCVCVFTPGKNINL
jgi:hypothetical protein